MYEHRKCCLSVIVCTSIGKVAFCRCLYEYRKRYILSLPVRVSKMLSFVVVCILSLSVRKSKVLSFCRCLYDYRKMLSFSRCLFNYRKNMVFVCCAVNMNTSWCGPLVLGVEARLSCNFCGVPRPRHTTFFVRILAVNTPVYTEKSADVQSMKASSSRRICIYIFAPVQSSTTSPPQAFLCGSVSAHIPP